MGVTMFRTPAARSLLRSLNKAPTARSSYSAASSQFRNTPALRQLSHKRPQVLAALSRPPTATVFYATKSTPPLDHIDSKAEKKIAETIIKPDPDGVSGESSVRHVFEQGQAPKDESGGEMTAGLKADLETIKETFSLSEVPKESLYIGAAGILPYAATSMSTVFLAFDEEEEEGEDSEDADKEKDDDESDEREDNEKSDEKKDSKKDDKKEKK